MFKIFITMAALVSLPAPAGAEIYKCRLADGKTEISNRPCPGGSGTVMVRPDETVSEASRRAAEQEVQRMRSFVEKREAAQRADEAAEREEQRAASQSSRNSSASRSPRAYGNADECLRNVEQMVLEASQRTQMEAECRNLVSPPPAYAPVVVPVHPHIHVHPQPAPPRRAEPPSGPGIAAPQVMKK